MLASSSQFCTFIYLSDIMHVFAFAFSLSTVVVFFVGIKSFDCSQRYGNEENFAVMEASSVCVLVGLATW